MVTPMYTPRQLLQYKVDLDKEKKIVDAALLDLCETEYTKEELIEYKHDIHKAEDILLFHFLQMAN
jgi:hypothetical protein